MRSKLQLNVALFLTNDPSTLQAIADHGPDVFYTGPFGKLLT
jgi:gamma-glutamyltranspeptidase